MTHPKIRSITFTPAKPDVDEAMLRVEYMLKLKKLRDELRERQDDDYLFSPNLSLENTQRINVHLSDAVKSIEVAIGYCVGED